MDRRKKALFKKVVVGVEEDMQTDARQALSHARKARGGVSLLTFMSGYGAQRVNDPEAIWDRKLLATISNRLTTLLMIILLLTVMALFWAAFSIQVATS